MSTLQAQATRSQQLKVTQIFAILCYEVGILPTLVNLVWVWNHGGTNTQPHIVVVNTTTAVKDASVNAVADRV